MDKWWDKYSFVMGVFSLKLSKQGKALSGNSVQSILNLGQEGNKSCVSPRGYERDNHCF